MTLLDLLNEVLEGENLPDRNRMDPKKRAVGLPFRDLEPKPFPEMEAFIPFDPELDEIDGNHGQEGQSKKKGVQKVHGALTILKRAMGVKPTHFAQ